MTWQLIFSMPHSNTVNSPTGPAPMMATSLRDGDGSAGMDTPIGGHPGGCLRASTLALPSDQPLSTPGHSPPAFAARRSTHIGRTGLGCRPMPDSELPMAVASLPRLDLSGTQAVAAWAAARARHRDVVAL